MQPQGLPIAGNVLRVPAVQSPNYVAGSSGWFLGQDGTAEFNSGQFRGSVLIGGPPAVGAVALGLRGTDIPAVLRNFSADYDVWYEADIYYYTTTDFYFRALVHNSVFGLAEFISGDVVSGAVHLQQFIDGPGGAANAIHFGTVPYNVDTLLVDFRQTNVVIRNSAHLYGANPADDTTEVWHAFPYNGALATPWTNIGGSTVTAQYRKVAAPDNCVQMVGAMSPGTKANTTVIGTLPTGYRPAHDVTIPGQCNNVVAGGESPHFDILQNGNVLCYGMTAATFASFAPAPFSLDA